MRRIGVLLGLAVAACAHAAQFSEGAGGSWQLIENDGVCRLEHPVGDYGLARFTGVAGQPLHFEVLGHRDLFAAGPVNLFRVAPPWHADFPQQQDLGQAPHRSGGGVNVSDPVATRVLMALYEGFDAQLRREGWFASEMDGSRAGVAVEVSSVNLRPLYEKFVHCFKGVLTMSWMEVERTRIAYSEKGWRLDEASRARLEAVAIFVSADPAVAGVFVDGHTDNMGSAKENASLSKRRAEAVAEFLKDCGVAAELLTVRFHGGGYPVGDNETEGGRARNRRTTVRLERAAPDVAQMSLE